MFHLPQLLLDPAPYPPNFMFVFFVSKNKKKNQNK